MVKNENLLKALELLECNDLLLDCDCLDDIPRNYKYINPLSKKWSNECLKKFVALDFETTGLSPKTDHIIEIGLVKYKNRKYHSRYSTLIKPPVHISYII